MTTQITLKALNKMPTAKQVITCTCVQEKD